MENETLLKERRLTAVYGRVSSINQENEGTIETQLAAVREYALQQGLIIVKEYKDEGWSGDNLERPSLDQLRMDAKKQMWDIVLLYDPDRLARRYSYQELVTDELKEKGIEVIYVTTPVPKNGVEKILFGVQGLFAEYERAKIAERFRLGKVRKAKEGNIMVSEPPIGYTFIIKKGKKGDENFRHGFYEINEKEAAIVKKIFSWVGDDHMTLRGVVRELQKLNILPRKSKRGVWSTSTLSTLLRNKTYIGEGHFGASTAIVPKKPLKDLEYRKIKKTSRRIKPESEWIKIATPQIINEELFTKAQQQLKSNFQFSSRNRKNEYLLAGKIWCTCGRRRAGEGAMKGKHLYYRCTDRVYSFPLSPTCLEKGINAKVADNLLWNSLFSLMTNSELLYTMVKEWVDKKQTILKEFVVDTTGLSEEIKKLKKQEQRFIKAYGMEVLSLEEFQSVVFPIRNEITTLNKKIMELGNDKKSDSGVTSVNENEIEKFVEFIGNSANQLNFIVRKKIVNEIIHKITGDKQKLLVKGVFPLSLNSNYVSLCTNGRNRQDSIGHPPYLSSSEEIKAIPFEFILDLPPPCIKKIIKKAA
ncbi:MAG: recombinase family protein [Ferruginibacter sp.]